MSQYRPQVTCTLVYWRQTPERTGEHLQEVISWDQIRKTCIWKQQQGLRHRENRGSMNQSKKEVEEYFLVGVQKQAGQKVPFHALLEQ